MTACLSAAKSNAHKYDLSAVNFSGGQSYTFNASSSSITFASKRYFTNWAGDPATML
ncbi:Uncharacterised protein [Vibrio cholerae]|nr:Uncharacterised protein [Vibrio cholerae]CSD25636.1 Uncharacterised protein [Vibrio cholerae]